MSTPPAPTSKVPSSHPIPASATPYWGGTRPAKERPRENPSVSKCLYLDLAGGDDYGFSNTCLNLFWWDQGGVPRSLLVTGALC